MPERRAPGERTHKNCIEMHDRLFGGVEAGGTKFVCAVGTGPNELIDIATFDTTTPDETLGRTSAFFRRHPDLAAIGIGSFGPVDPEPESPTFGYITSTPKEGWTNTNFASRLQEELGVAVAFDTDVNAAALGELQWGAAQDLDTFIYLTVGTGIGGGGLSRGSRLRGLVHPEMGHLRVPRAEGDRFQGVCPYHGDCLEGMASGPAIRARTGRPPRELEPSHPAWTFQVHYLSMALVNYICVLSPERIILGGGVMNQRDLFPRIRVRVVELINGYIQADAILKDISSYIVPPLLGNRAGVLGAIALANEACVGSRNFRPLDGI